MANILSISSQVVRGAVGNSAGVFAMQRLGHTVWPIPTVLYSNHPGHGDFSGNPLAAGDIEALWRGIAEHGWSSQVDAVLTGYLPNEGVVMMVASIIGQLKRDNPKLMYLCDPAIGDAPKGLYVPETAARAVRDRLLPLADIATPNCFELSWLTGTKMAINARAAVDAMTKVAAGSIVSTSVPANSADELCNVLHGGGEVHICRAQRIASAPNGTGDFFSAVYLACCLNGAIPVEALGRATASVRAVLEGSAGADELQLAGTQETWAGAAGDPTERLQWNS